LSYECAHNNARRRQAEAAGDKGRSAVDPIAILTIVQPVFAAGADATEASLAIIVGRKGADPLLGAEYGQDAGRLRGVQVVVAA